MIDQINPRDFDYTITKLRNFFKSKEFFEAHVQHRLSILAACEDPVTIGSFDYNGRVWPLPQTGQMQLELELLKDPSLHKIFTVTTSYRQEADPIPGRHSLIFPMFEFESSGNFGNLLETVNQLLLDLQFKSINSYYYIPYIPDVISTKEGTTLAELSPVKTVTLNYPILEYEEACEKYSTNILTAQDETKIWEDFGDVVFLVNFPERTSPFWNMRRNGPHAKKLDVLLYGMETIGSAEREIEPSIMINRFRGISNGEYSNLLYAHFGKDRVLDELYKFLSLDFFPRYGGGIGITRMIRALNMRDK
jgi:aspartyl/asparaginyl-tRNA synthetase